MDMPFGKHKGLPVDLLPLDYAIWLKHNCKLWPHLAEAIEFRLLGNENTEADIDKQIESALHQ